MQNLGAGRNILYFSQFLPVSNFAYLHVFCQKNWNCFVISYIQHFSRSRSGLCETLVMQDSMKTSGHSRLYCTLSIGHALHPGVQRVQSAQQSWPFKDLTHHCSLHGLATRSTSDVVTGLIWILVSQCYSIFAIFTIFAISVSRCFAMFCKSCFASFANTSFTRFHKHFFCSFTFVLQD